MKKNRMSIRVIRLLLYILCIGLVLLTVVPLWTMIVNATRSSAQIQQGISLLPSRYLTKNWEVIARSGVNLLRIFGNSLVISGSSTILCVYFSALAAYGLVTYRFRGRAFFDIFIIIAMMIPGSVSLIGFYRFMYSIGMTNSFIPLIIPSIATPGTVFFMRQYLLGISYMEIIESARIDGAGELQIFNRIMLPMLSPAVATQVIFSFVGSWNSLLKPMMLLTDKSKRTITLFVASLKFTSIYKIEYGAIYLGCAISLVPILVVYFLLSKWIIAGVALGSVKE